MAATEPVNSQQILQMGSHTEKLQQTLQQQPLVLSVQLEEERVNTTELKQTEVQESSNTEPTDPSRTYNRAQSGRVRVQPKKQSSFVDVEKKNKININEERQGHRVDLII